MPYDYKFEKPKLFTEEHQADFLKVRDNVNRLLRDAGAFRLEEAIKGITGSSWTMIAMVDRLLELKEIEEVPTNGFLQHRIFTRDTR